MNLLRPPTLLLFVLSSAAIATATPPTTGHGIQFLPKDRKPPVGSAINDETLKNQRSTGKFGGFAPEGSGPKGWDLMENSEFIAFDGIYTLLPKGAILHVPEKLRQHVVEKPEGKLMLWSEFAGRYRGLVNHFNVTLEQAAGQAAVPQELFESARESGLIVVAMMNGNPVSVNPKAMAPVATNR